MHLPLKEYQERTLEALTAYYQNCLRLQNANTAFYNLIPPLKAYPVCAMSALFGY